MDTWITVDNLYLQDLVDTLKSQVEALGADGSGLSAGVPRSACCCGGVMGN